MNLPTSEGDGAGVGDAKVDMKDFDEDKGEIGSYSSTSPRIQITQRINHDGEVNRARYCPQNCDLVATRAVNGLTYVFDRTKHSNQPDPDGKAHPDITLRGQTKEGYGIAWNPLRQGQILSASEDTTVCLWDINAYDKETRTLDPLQTYRGHSSVVEDVAWHNYHENLFASVGDDHQMLLWDTREKSDSPKHRVEAHNAEVNAVAFSTASEYIVATGSSDTVRRTFWLALTTDGRPLGPSEPQRTATHARGTHRRDPAARVVSAPRDRAVHGVRRSPRERVGSEPHRRGADVRGRRGRARGAPLRARRPHGAPDRPVVEPAGPMENYYRRRRQHPHGLAADDVHRRAERGRGAGRQRARVELRSATST